MKFLFRQKHTKSAKKATLIITFMEIFLSMLNNWLRPVSEKLFKEVDSLEEDRMGKNILTFKDELPDLKKTKNSNHWNRFN